MNLEIRLKSSKKLTRREERPALLMNRCMVVIGELNVTSTGSELDGMKINFPPPPLPMTIFVLSRNQIRISMI